MDSFYCLSLKRFSAAVANCVGSIFSDFVILRYSLNGYCHQCCLLLLCPLSRPFCSFSLHSPHSPLLHLPPIRSVYLSVYLPPLSLSLPSSLPSILPTPCLLPVCPCRYQLHRLSEEASSMRKYYGPLLGHTSGTEKSCINTLFVLLIVHHCCGTPLFVLLIVCHCCDTRIIYSKAKAYYRRYDNIRKKWRNLRNTKVNEYSNISV